jgi:hypothetical protein
MTQPYLTKKEINRMSLAEMEDKLRSLGTDLPVIRYWHDEPDPFLMNRGGKCECADCDPEGASKRKLELTATYLHSASFRQWLNGLSLAEVKKEMKAWKVSLTAWEARTFTLAQLRQRLAGAIERQ